MSDYEGIVSEEEQERLSHSGDANQQSLKNEEEKEGDSGEQAPEGKSINE